MIAFTKRCRSVRQKCLLRLSMSTSDSSWPKFSFKSQQSSKTSKARTGLITTPHGNVETPNFVFCATKASIKGGITAEQLRAEDTQIILSNTYHLMLTPGSRIIEKMGGLQQMTGWRGPMLTDSGGYQIFSMGHGSVSNEIKGKRNADSMGWEKSLIKIDENGAKFRSYVDGSIHYLTPERSMQIQYELGADLVVVLDECTPFNVDKAYTAASMRRSHRWALRSLDECLKLNRETQKQALYGIIQGGTYEDLRDESCAFVNDNNFFGLAIGGSLGNNRETMHKVVAYTRSKLRNDRPIHLLGIGGVRDIFHGVKQGIDTFDCVHPSRLARHGGALVKAKFWSEVPHIPSEPNVLYTTVPLTEEEKVVRDKRSHKLEKDKEKKKEKNDDDNISQVEKEWKASKRVNVTPLAIANGKPREHVDVTRAVMKEDSRPIDEDCECYTCRNFSRAYLHHLFRAKESLGGTLVTIHNIHFMNRLMKDIREGVKQDRLDAVEKEYVHESLKDKHLEGTEKEIVE
jgi:queuine tRNA-ribosyltransferase